MGGNSSYSKEWGGVPEMKRTHDETGYTIERHKVLVSKTNPRQNKNILNSNTDNTTYIIAKRNEDGTLEAKSINIYKNHNLSYEINLIFDSKGDIVPYNNGKGSHAHLWEIDSNGILSRKRHSRNNTYQIDSKYDSLIQDIVNFNKRRNK